MQKYKYFSYLFLVLLFFFKTIPSPVAVDLGGTSRTAATAYTILLGGTTATTLQYLPAGVGTSGQLLMSGGASTPIWQTNGALPGYIAGTGFAFAGTTATLAASPDRTIIISTSTPASITSAATDNIALGYNALNSVTSNVKCIAIGSSALAAATGSNNIGIGYQAGLTISTGTDNIAIGVTALDANSTGSYNVAVGANACSVSTVSGLTAVGSLALSLSTTGTENVACGISSGRTGNRNTSCGDSALTSASVGNDNAAVGYQALTGSTGSFNVALGQISTAVTAGSNNILIGRLENIINASNSNSILLGTAIALGSAYVFGVTGVTTSGGINAKIDGFFQLGTISSSQRFKYNIKRIDQKIVDKMLNLEVLQFNYIGDKTKEIHYGMIAEDVEKIFPEVVVYDKNGEISTVQYSSFIPLIIKQIQNDDLTELKNQLKNIENQVISLINSKGS